RGRHQFSLGVPITTAPEHARGIGSISTTLASTIKSAAVMAVGDSTSGGDRDLRGIDPLRRLGSLSTAEADEMPPAQKAPPLKHIRAMRRCFLRSLQGGKRDEAYRRSARLGGVSVDTGHGLWATA